jgi:beta-glucosidase
LKITPTAVSFTLTNSGGRPGAEVPQLYIGYPSEAGEPPKVLRGFSKHYLGAGESQTVGFAIKDSTTRVWDVATHGWKHIEGEFGLYVGSSSRDIRLTGKMMVGGRGSIHV